MGFDITSEHVARDFFQEFNQLYGGVFGDQYDKYEGMPLKISDMRYHYEFEDDIASVYYGPEELPITELIKEVYRAKYYHGLKGVSPVFFLLY